MFLFLEILRNGGRVRQLLNEQTVRLIKRQWVVRLRLVQQRMVTLQVTIVRRNLTQNTKQSRYSSVSQLSPKQC